MTATNEDLVQALLCRWGLDEDKELTTRQAARLIPQASVSTLNKWRTEGRGPAYRHRGYWVRYRAEDVARWLVAQVIPEDLNGWRGD